MRAIDTRPGRGRHGPPGAGQRSCLAGGLALCLLLLVAPPAWADGKLTAPEAFALAQAGSVTLVDVRSPAEWRETGIPKGAEAVTIHNPRGLAGFLDALLERVEGDRSRPVALICAAGGRSARARRYLEAQGFTDVRDVSEGMLGRPPAPGWLARGLPTEPCPRC